MMQLARLVIALVFAALAGAAQAQTVAVVVKATPVQAVARLATQGIGYSVVHAPVGVSSRSYRVLLACTVSWRNAAAQCPTPAHDAYCPDARIVCR